MAGGTTFHFVTDGIDAALALAVDAAQGADIRLGGGASTIQQFLRAGLIDSMHIAVAPVLLGGGERLFPEEPIAYECEQTIASERVTHYVFVRSS
jgi:dihydrofolate reductase